MEEKTILIPYMVVSVNPHTFEYSTNVTPGSFTVPLKENYQEDMAKFFYEETVKYMVENNTTRFKTIREYNEYFCGKLNVKMIPFTIYFFYNKEWNVFLYSEEDLLALYHIRYRDFYFSDFLNDEQYEKELDYDSDDTYDSNDSHDSEYSYDSDENIDDLESNVAINESESEKV